MATKKTTELNAEETCFVIMPFGSWFDNYFSEIYQPAILNAGLIPKRADDIYRPSTIVQDIWNYTQGARLVLADLTGKNANVFYELGLAHALAKPAILVTNSMDDVPFDLRALRVIEYNKNDCNWGNVLKEKIEKSIRETLESPLNSVLPAFLNINNSEKTKITINEKDFLELKRDLEMLRNEIRHSSSRIENRIPAYEAIELIKKYLNSGIPTNLILDRMYRYGVPGNWVINKIEELSNEAKLLSVDSGNGDK